VPPAAVAPGAFPPSDLFGSGFDPQDPSPPADNKGEGVSPPQDFTSASAEVAEAFFPSSGNNKNVVGGTPADFGLFGSSDKLSGDFLDNGITFSSNLTTNSSSVSLNSNNNQGGVDTLVSNTLFENKNNNATRAAVLQTNLVNKPSLPSNISNVSSLGHVRSSSLAEPSAMNRVKANEGKGSSGGHVRTGSGGAVLCQKPVENLTASEPQAMATPKVTAPLLKSNNPFLCDMTAEELAMANLDLANEVQEADLLNFCEVPTTISERNKQASAHIMQMFNTVAGGNPNGPPPTIPPKPITGAIGIGPTPDGPPMLPPKPLPHNPVHQSVYTPQINTLCSTSTTSATAVNPSLLPQSKYHNVNYGGQTAATTAGYDAVTMMRHQHLVQQQQPQTQTKPTQKAEDWLMSQLP